VRVNINIDPLSAPKGHKDSAQGFNPGLLVPMKCALKVAPKAITQSDRTPTRAATVHTGATFRARFRLTPNPGLKPWAESLCPFGAESAHRLGFIPYVDAHPKAPRVN
jgi:hypothetical protein